MTVVVVGVGAARPTAVEPLRVAAGDVFAPAERLLTARNRQIDTLTQQRDQARRQLAQQHDNAAEIARLEGLASAASVDNLRYVAAQVVGFSTDSATGQLREVTLDVGADDGVLTNQAVVASAGLAGRVVTVSAHSCDVQLLTDPAAVVGVRVGASAALGTVSNTTPPGLSARGAGLLTLTLVSGGSVAAGDTVRTLGSPGDRPYPSNVVVGTVISVDPDRGQPGVTAVVRPAVDLATLDMVAVVAGTVQQAPRRVLQGLS